MKLHGKNVLIEFVARHADARKGIESLVAEIEESRWENPHDVKERYPAASIVGKGNVIFNIRGNRFRVHVRVAYRNGVVLVVQAGTHEDYNDWMIE